jgi:anti-anti-sigma factor
MNDETISPAAAPAVLQPEGNLVAANLPALRTKLRQFVAAGTQDLTLDLARVQMVDSTGIGLLISTHNSLKKAGGTLSVTNASKDILALFHTMRIHQHFTVSGS